MLFEKHRKLKLTKPEFAFIVGTRALFAGGIAMLAAGMVPAPIRRAVGIGLVAIGAITTIPAARTLLKSM
jgi:hypothetical protein